VTAKAKAEKVRRVIKGETYLFTRTAYGWGVAPAGKRGDMSRTHRGYNVHCAADGLPVRCSCPSFVEGGRRCKHMEEVDKMREEQTPPPDEGPGYRDFAPPKEDDPEAYAETVREERVEREAGLAITRPVSDEHVLVNDTGWTLVYEVRGDRVRIGRCYRGAEVSSLDVPRAHARRHYAAMKIEGFKKP
jgi:hypothetical protein